jgi:hypothetical protein
VDEDAVPKAKSEPQSVPPPAPQPPKPAPVAQPAPASYSPLPEKEPEITEHDKQRFVLSVISNEPYTETVSFFGGAIQVTYQTLSAQMIDMLTCALGFVADDQTIPAIMRQSFVIKYSTAAQVAGITFSNGAIALPPITATNDFNKLSESFMNRYNAITKNLASAVVVGALTNNLDAFNHKCRFLSSKAFDENFWKPIQ